MGSPSPAAVTGCHRQQACRPGSTDSTRQGDLGQRAVTVRGRGGGAHLSIGAGAGAGDGPRGPPVSQLLTEPASLRVMSAEAPTKQSHQRQHW